MRNKTLKEQLAKWNNEHPYDLAWRIKNNVQFGSQEHKSMDFISMLFNLIQEHEIEDYINRDKVAQENAENEVFDSPDVVPMTKEEVDAEFDNLDLDEFNNIENGHSEGNNI